MAFDFDVTVHTINNPQGKTVAFANLTIDGEIEVGGFKVINGPTGLFVAPPNRKSNKLDDKGNPIYFDDVRFVGTKPEGEGFKRTDIQNAIYKLILDRYNEKAATSARGSAATAQATAMSNPASKLW